MPRFRKRPIEVDAHQWFQNGDHPDDKVGQIVRDPGGGLYTAIEGRVVRYFRRPDRRGTDVHADGCGRTWHDHGWIDTLEGGHIVCPGDWIITGHVGERYPCKPDVFADTYEPVDKDGLAVGGPLWDDVYRKTSEQVNVAKRAARSQRRAVSDG